MLNVKFKLIKTEYGAGSLQLLKISKKLFVIQWEFIIGTALITTFSMHR